MSYKSASLKLIITIFVFVLIYFVSNNLIQKVNIPSTTTPPTDTSPPPTTTDPVVVQNMFGPFNPDPNFYDINKTFIALPNSNQSVYNVVLADVNKNRELGGYDEGSKYPNVYYIMYVSQVVGFDSYNTADIFAKSIFDVSANQKRYEKHTVSINTDYKLIQPVFV